MFDEPNVWGRSLEERRGRMKIRIGQRGENREGRKNVDERERDGQKREGTIKLTITQSKQVTSQTRSGAFWQHSFDKDHR